METGPDHRRLRHELGMSGFEPRTAGMGIINIGMGNRHQAQAFRQQPDVRSREIAGNSRVGERKNQLGVHEAL